MKECCALPTPNVGATKYGGSVETALSHPIGVKLPLFLQLCIHITAKQSVHLIKLLHYSLTILRPVSEQQQTPVLELYCGAVCMIYVGKYSTHPCKHILQD